MKKVLIAIGVALALAAAVCTALYVSTRQVTISGNGILAQLTVDIVYRYATSTVGRVAYGTGTVTLGNTTYNAETVHGVVDLGNNAAHLVIYTGDTIISLLYYNGQYYAVVKPLGKLTYERFNGTATLQIQ